MTEASRAQELCSGTSASEKERRKNGKKNLEFHTEKGWLPDAGRIRGSGANLDDLAGERRRLEKRSPACPESLCEVAEAISRFEPVTMLASDGQYENCRAMCPPEVTVLELSSDDAWARDVGPSFLVDGKGGLRACDWTFNAWGGLVDGLYFPWDKDDRTAEKICELAGADSYRRKALCWRAAPFMWTGRERR